MAHTFKIKQNDTGPAFLADLQDGDGNIVDLAGISGVDFHMTKLNGSVKVNAAAVVVDPAAGRVRYDWAAGDTDTVGTFHVEFEVDFGGNLRETFPNDGYLEVVVTRELA